jgi:hypothetical protein
MGWLGFLHRAFSSSSWVPMEILSRYRPRNPPHTRAHVCPQVIAIDYRHFPEYLVLFLHDGSDIAPQHPT